MTATLSGTWEMVRAELAGADAPDMLALRVELELTADTYIVRFAGQVADRGTYALACPEPVERVESAERGARALTLTGAVGPNKGRTIPCIFQLTGDRLRVCYGLDGTAPTVFATAPGTEHYLATYRRKAP